MKPTNRKTLKTRSGRIINIDRPNPNDFILDDIAFGLSNICRFAGQRKFYNVLDHSLDVFATVRGLGGSLRDQLYALLHDASEAYLNDLPSPVKTRCRDYQKIEDRFLQMILENFGISGNMPEVVKKADDIALEFERSVPSLTSTPGHMAQRELFKNLVWETYNRMKESNAKHT